MVGGRGGSSPSQKMGQEAETGVLVTKDEEGQLSLLTLDGLGVIQLDLDPVREEAEVVPGQVAVLGEDLAASRWDEAGKSSECDPEHEEEAAPD